MRGRLGDGRDAPGGAHDQRLGQARLCRPLGQRVQVTLEHGTEIGVDSGRGGSLVLAELGCDLVRGDDARSRQPSPQLAYDRLLVARVAKREEEADRDRLSVDLGERLEIERAKHPFRPNALTDSEAALEGHERLWMILAQPVEMCARLAADVEDVLETGRRHESCARALPLEQRVRGHRCPMRETVEPAGADRAGGGEHGLFLTRRGRYLSGRDSSVRHEDGIDESSADVDAENGHGSTLVRVAPDNHASATSKGRNLPADTQVRKVLASLRADGHDEVPA